MVDELIELHVCCIQSYSSDCNEQPSGENIQAVVKDIRNDCQVFPTLRNCNKLSLQDLHHWDLQLNSIPNPHCGDSVDCCVMVPQDGELPVTID